MSETEPSGKPPDANDCRRRIALEWRGDFDDRVLDADGRIPITAEERTDLHAAADLFWRDARAVKVLHRGGHPFPHAYASPSRHWTSCSRTVLINGRRVMLICNHPGSFAFRLMTMFRHVMRGLPVRRHLGGKWKQQVEKNSLVPVIPLNNRRMAAFPYIDGINGYDLFRHSSDIRVDDPRFAWVAQCTDGTKLRLLSGVARHLADLHAHGITWAEPWLTNVLFSADGRPVLVDAETYYVRTSLADQKKFDRRALEASAIKSLPHVSAEAVRAAVAAGYEGSA